MEKDDISKLSIDEFSKEIKKTNKKLNHFKFFNFNKNKLKEKKKTEKPKTKEKKEKKEKKPFRQFFEFYIPRAGVELEFEEIKQKIIKFSIILTILFIFGTFFYSLITNSFHIYYMLFIIFIGTPLFYFCAYWLSFLGFTIYMEIKIYNRKRVMETVLPDFLKLTSSNVRSGMTIDRALWGAIRPQFGILAKEMELVAKQTMSGEDLDSALLKFSKKYDSTILDRSIQLLIEGIDAGGELAEILDKISINLHDTQAMQKEMAANVTSYIMFITIAAVVATPCMFALSKQLITITQNIMADMNTDSSTQNTMFGGGGEGGVELEKFNTFAWVTVVTISGFSAMICSVIKKGNIRSGFKTIPIYAGISYFIYIIASNILKNAFTFMFP
jgi:pilus assembly protein TadC